jgi:CHAT domain-containing protein
VIVPDGPLHSLPFEALPVRVGAARKSLIEDFAVSYAPSATVLAAVSAERSGSAARREDLIAFADPAPPAQPSTRGGSAAGRSAGEWAPAALARIPGARREVESIARYVSRGSKVYMDAEASESRLKRERLDRYRVLHFATHGLLSLENPGRSALLLAAPAGGKEDGLLQAREISELELSSELVVLSGCETARGRTLSGEGVQSLARAFFLAGARSVVASLWKVRDRAAEDLMTAFYRRLSEGRTKDEALRGAKLELLRRPQTASARDWGSFVLIGEASARIPLSPGSVRPRDSDLETLRSSRQPPARR